MTQLVGRQSFCSRLRSLYSAVRLSDGAPVDLIA